MIGFCAPLARRGHDKRDHDGRHHARCGLPRLLTDGAAPAQHRAQLAAHRRGRRSRRLAGPENHRHADGDRSRRASRRIQRHRDQSEAPAGKTFASFDFDAAPGVRKQHLLALGAGGDWIRNGDNLLLFGKSGTGKSHAMAAICHALIDAGKRVLFTRTIDIVQRLQTARRDLALIGALDKLDKFDLNAFVFEFLEHVSN